MKRISPAEINNEKFDLDIEDDVLYFIDLYGNPCSLQNSSVHEVIAVWFGVGDQRMHLSQKMVKRLLPFLKRFADTGRI
jgi:hypothetical protein